MELFILASAVVTLIGMVYLLILINRILSNLSGQTDLGSKLDLLRSAMEISDKTLKDDNQRTRTELLGITKDNRAELNNSISQLAEGLSTGLATAREESTKSVMNLINQFNLDAKSNREELSSSLKTFSETLSLRLAELTKNQQMEFEHLRKNTEDKLNKIQHDNEEKLEKIRLTVDNKLHETLEKRLGESFQIVSDRLEQVHKGLGEMQSLATGVGDLKKVLTGVKTRGVLGEVQLENILTQILTPEQFEQNFKPYSRREEIVEFAIKLPGREKDLDTLYLPIDAKFPIENYHRLCDAYEQADISSIESEQRKLIKSVRDCAKDIRDKYINPPITTDFALMFLPFEGLYAEVLRQSGVFENIQKDYSVIIVGPSTISAILNSLQMGFRTLAIEKRSSEVWKVLSAVKTEFGKFGDILDKTQKKLIEAGNVIEQANLRSRQIHRRLKGVEELPSAESKEILQLPDQEDDFG